MADWLTYSNQGAIRNQQLSNELRDALGRVASAMGLTVEVFSGGQDAKGRNRTGSHRHDHGNAGDVFFSKDGRRLDWANPKDLPVFKEIVQRAKAAGITGIGAGPGYMRPGSMHLGFGSPMTWGAGGRSKNAPGWLSEAYNSASVARPQLPITPSNPPLPTPRPTAPLNAAPTESIRRQPLGPASLPPDRMMPSGLLPNAPVDRIRPMPGGTLPQTGVDPRMLAAYQQMAQSRMAAPVNPVQQPQLAAPQQPAAPPLGPPRQVRNYPIYQAPIPQTPVQQPVAPSAPSAAPSLPSDHLGNTWQDGPMGRSITNRFGVTTIQRPDGTTASPGGPFGNMDTSRMGGMVRTGLGGGLGAMLGGAVAGPIGGIVGGAIGRELANGRNQSNSGGLGGLLGGMFGGSQRDPWAGQRESSRSTSQSSGSSRSSSSSSGSRRDTRDRPDYR